LELPLAAIPPLGAECVEDKDGSDQLGERLLPPPGEDKGRRGMREGEAAWRCLVKVKAREEVEGRRV
jgi:hypothetical protein